MFSYLVLVAVFQFCCFVIWGMLGRWTNETTKMKGLNTGRKEKLIWGGKRFIQLKGVIKCTESNYTPEDLQIWKSNVYALSFNFHIIGFPRALCFVFGQAVNDTLVPFQLTWQTGVNFVCDRTCKSCAKTQEAERLDSVKWNKSLRGKYQWWRAEQGMASLYSMSVIYAQHVFNAVLIRELERPREDTYGVSRTWITT